MKYTTYIRNEITMETVDIIVSNSILTVFKIIRSREVFESAFSVCEDNTIIDWRFVNEAKLKEMLGEREVEN